jgi:hypothetical protein
MKTLIILSLVLFSISSQAINLACVTQKTIETSTGPVTAFTLTDIEKSDSEMESSLPDQNTLFAFESDEAGLVTGASFSNECDNMYVIVFKTDAFKAVVSGAAFSLTGQIDFSSADGTNSSTSVECRVYSTGE